MNINQAAARLVKELQVLNGECADKVPPGWFTRKELAEQLKKDEASIRRAMAKLLPKGKVQVKTFRIVNGVHKVLRPVPHYKFAD